MGFFKQIQAITRITYGKCPVCDKKTLFVGIGYWYRDQYRCVRCLSVPRVRALMKTLREIDPDYCRKTIHESSPGGFFLKKMKRDVPNYSYSYYYEGKKPGVRLQSGATNESIEDLSFSDEQFDIFITQDVLEHVFHPLQAFKEIERVLKPGGFHIFTTPISFYQNTVQRAALKNGTLEYIHEPVFHRNPIDRDGSLVTFDWGGDIISILNRICPQMQHQLYIFRNSKDNYRSGIEGDYLEVVVSRKNDDC